MILNVKKKEKENMVAFQLSFFKFRSERKKGGKKHAAFRVFGVISFELDDLSYSSNQRHQKSYQQYS